MPLHLQMLGVFFIICIIGKGTWLVEWTRCSRSEEPISEETLMSLVVSVAFLQNIFDRIA